MKETLLMCVKCVLPLYFLKERILFYSQRNIAILMIHWFEIMKTFVLVTLLLLINQVETELLELLIVTRTPTEYEVLS